MKASYFARFIVSAVSLVMILGPCQSEGVPDSALTRSPSPEHIQEVVVTCTLLGCYDALGILIEGEVPAEYIVIAEDAVGRTAAIHCFANSQQIFWSGEVMIPHELTLADAEVETLEQRTMIPSLCNSDEGYVGYDSTQGGEILWVVGQCFTPKKPALLHNSRCTENGVIFADYIPEDLVLTISWNGFSKVVETRPTYTSSWPNGEGCPPECRSSVVTVTLP